MAASQEEIAFKSKMRAGMAGGWTSIAITGEDPVAFLQRCEWVLEIKLPLDDMTNCAGWYHLMLLGQSGNRFPLAEYEFSAYGQSAKDRLANIFPGETINIAGDNPIAQLCYCEFVLLAGRTLTNASINLATENFPKVRYAPQAFPYLSNLLGVRGGPQYRQNEVRRNSSSRVELTPTEERDLIWEQGDYYEIVSGNLSFTGSRKYNLQTFGELCTQKTFFFESQDPQWKTKEWQLTTETDIPNGPALMVLIRRGNQGTVFGLVSLVNKAWTHVMPLGANDMIKDSSKMRELSKMHSGAVVKGIAGALIGGSLGKQSAQTQMQPFKQAVQQLTATARAFMFRIAQSADQYWQGGSGPTNGKL